MPTTSLIALEDIHAARERIAGTAVRTGLYLLDPQRMRAAGFHLQDGAPEIWLKAENEQPIGSFKLRGAYNKIASLTPGELQRGVITYSSGNHAQGVAFAARALGAKAVIVMPESAPRIKREATLAMGAEVVLVGPASSERRQRAEDLVAAHGYVMVPPYDDDYVIAGQATCGLGDRRAGARCRPGAVARERRRPAQRRCDGDEADRMRVPKCGAANRSWPATPPKASAGVSWWSGPAPRPRG